MRTRDGFLVSILTAMSLAVGCGGGQTGDLGGFDNGTEAGGNCDEKEQPLESVDAETDLGFSASDFLEWVEGTHESSLAWGSSDAVDFSPSGTSTNVSIAIDCPEPNPRFVDSEPKGSNGLAAAEPAFGDLCPDLIRVDCELTVTTEDGGFEETYAVSVDASAPTLARISLPLEPDSFEGSFEIGEPRAANTSVKQLTLDLMVSRFGVAGSVSSVLESSSDGAVSASWVTYARWPVETCEGAGPNTFVVDEDSNAGEVSADAIVEQLAPDAERSIEWEDGEQALLSLTVSPDSTGCVEFDPYQDAMTALYPASVEASSDDGRLDLLGEGSLRAEFDLQGELVYASIEVSAEPTTEQVATLMASSVEEAEQLASQYDDLELTVTQSFDLGMSMGYVRLLGADIPDCLSNPPEPMENDSGGGAPGCAGIDQQVVYEGNWTP